MAQTSPTTVFLAGADVISVENLKSQPAPVRQVQRPRQRPHYTLKIVWRNVIAFAILHSFAAYGFYRLFLCSKLETILFSKCAFDFILKKYRYF